MDEIVAMEHVHAIPRCVPRNNLHSFVWTQPYDVLKCDSFIRLDAPSAISTRDDLEINQMDVNWVTPSTTLVDQLPDLNGTSLRLCENSSIDPVGPEDAVHVPFVTITLEHNRVVDALLRWRVRNSAQWAGNITIASSAGRLVLADAEFYTLRSVW